MDFTMLCKRPASRVRTAPLFVLLALPLFGSCDRTRTATCAKPPNPSYVQVVSLSETKDATHVTAVEGPDETTWYREELPGLTLANLRYSEADVHQRPDGSWCIDVRFRGEVSRSLIYQWTSTRVGGSIGMMFGAHVQCIYKLNCPLRDTILLGSFTTRAEAETEAAIIRAGGIYPDADYSPG